MSNDDRCRNCGRLFSHPNQYTYRNLDGKWTSNTAEMQKVCRNACPAWDDIRRLEAWNIAVKDWR